MDTAFFFQVWDIYQSHWGQEEQRELKKQHSARQLEKVLRKSHRMKGVYFMHHLLRMLWEDETNQEDNQEELLDIIRSMGMACMGEEDTCDNSMDPYTRMMEDVHVYHEPCCLSVEQRQWLSLRKPKPPYHTCNNIYGLSAILVLPYYAI